jgi:ferredoxin
MPDMEIEPTYKGKNKGLVFKVPTELFSIRLGKEIDPELKKEFYRYAKGTFKGLQLAIKTISGNENNYKTETSPEFWKDFEKKAKEMGVDLIGYTPVNENYIFKNNKIYGKNAIMLAQELNWEKVKTIPSVEFGIEFFRVYQELGEKVIELTNYLKEKGYKSEAHHPFGGKLLYPYHAVAAKLGIIGRSGLVLTPEFGPRQRWGAITTDADIPESQERDFSEMEDFCKNCGACIKNCKGGALLEDPIEKVEGSGIFTRIDRSKCIDSLINNTFCSYCMRICSQGHPKKK